MRSELLDRLTPVGGLAHQDHVWLNGNQCGDPLSYDGMVIDRENSNSSSTRVHRALPLIKSITVSPHIRQPGSLCSCRVSRASRNPQFHFGAGVYFTPNLKLATDQCGAFPNTG